MKRTTSRQYRIMQKFARDLFKNGDYVNARKLSIEIQNNLSPFATRFKNYLLEMQLLQEKHKLFYPGPMLRHFKNKDFVVMNRLRKIGDFSIIEKELHFTTKSRNPTIEVPENWEVHSKSNYKIVFKIKD